jgi:hypothetical protein
MLASETRTRVIRAGARTCGLLCIDTAGELSFVGAGLAPARGEGNRHPRHALITYGDHERQPGMSVCRGHRVAPTQSPAVSCYRGLSEMWATTNTYSNCLFANIMLV